MDVKRKKRRKINALIPVAVFIAVLAVILIITNTVLHKDKKEREDATGNETSSTRQEETSTEVMTTTQTPTTAEYDVEIADITVKSTVESLDLSGKTFDSPEALMEKLNELKSLKYVDMCDCGFSNEEMEKFISEFPNVKFVWKIEIKEHGSIRTDAVAFSTLNNGTSTYRLTNEDAKVFKYCTDMRILDLGHNSITDLSFLKNMPELRILIIVDDLNPEDSSHYRITDISDIRYCKKLSYLELFLNEISDISALAELDNLIDINICHNRISNIDALMNKPKLQRLYIKNNQISQQDAKRLEETYPDARVVYTGDFESTSDGWRFDENEVKHERYALMREIIEEVHGLAQCGIEDKDGKDILEKHNFYSVFG